MSRLFLLALLLCPVPARAYSILWGPLVSSWSVASAEAHTVFQGSDYDSATDPAHAHADAWIADASALADGVAGINYCGGSGIGSDSDSGALGACYGSGMFRRAFRVLGGSGAVDVTLGGQVDIDVYSPRAYDALAGWSLGVEGLGEVGESWAGGSTAWRSAPVAWTGALHYGQTYVASASAWSGTSAGSAYARLDLDAPGTAQPIPEPASLLLLGLGLAGVGLARRPVRGRPRVCIQSVFRGPRP